jgi:hypothetical protein
MEEWNSVPLGLPVGQNETTNTHWLSWANQQETRTGVYGGPEEGQLLV